MSIVFYWVCRACLKRNTEHDLTCHWCGVVRDEQCETGHREMPARDDEGFGE